MGRSTSQGPVVVTGGAGAIGHVLVRDLLDRGHEVRVVDNLSSGRREALPDPAATPQLSLTVADLREPAAWSSLFQGAEAVWHLAANPDIRLGTSDPRIDLEHGTLASFNVLEAARRHSVPRAYFSSSSVVYGFPTVFPTPESYGPLEPQSLYAASKLAAEGLFSAYAHCYGLRSYLYRFANIIGPGMTHGVMHDFFEKLKKDPKHLQVLGDGRQSKSYLRTEDCVAGMLVAADRADERVNIFNLGTSDRISVREIAEKVVRLHGGTARIEYTGGTQGWAGDVPQQLLGIDRIQALGWRPSHTSAAAVDRTLAEMALARGIGR
jgi:UDP-glucose 4-epimerase